MRYFEFFRGGVSVGMFAGETTEDAERAQLLDVGYHDVTGFDPWDGQIIERTPGTIEYAAAKLRHLQFRDACHESLTLIQLEMLHSEVVAFADATSNALWRDSVRATAHLIAGQARELADKVWQRLLAES